MKIRKNCFLIIAALIIATGLMAVAGTNSSAAATQVTNCKKWHTVQKGETLKSIAQIYDVRWWYLYNLNGLKNPNKITPGQELCVSTTGNPASPTPISASPSSKVYAASVKEDQTVSLVGKDLAPLSRYTIYLSNFKAKYPVNYLVGTVTTSQDGTFKATYKIPSKLHDVVKIRITATNNLGDAVTNWFFNGTYESNTGGIGSPTMSFVVQSVDKDSKVKIKISNLRPNTTFKVYMGKAGSQGVNGILVGTIKDSSGGTKTYSFEIPSKLHGKSKLDLRVENEILEIVAYQTFENK